MNKRALLDDGPRAALLWGGGAAGALWLLAAVLAPERAWGSLLVGNFYFLAMSVFGAVFIAIQYAASAGWPVVLRRVPEAMTGYLPAAAVLALVSLPGLHHLYPWTHEGAGHHGAAALAGKAAYLNVPWFCARGAAFLGAWWLLARLLVRNSRAQDESRAPELTRANVRLSALFLVVFAVTFSLASIDWLMSLEPLWFSTLYPWYVFSGLFVGGIAVLCVLAVCLRRRGVLPGIGENHLHDLGKYLFAFSCFWAYLWFCQYLLIWYSNIPEEAAYYAARSSRGWIILQGASLALNFLAPFVLLLSAAAKKSEDRLLAGALVVCAGRVLDVYLLVIPAVAGAARPHWADAAAFLGAGAVFVLLFDRSFRAAGPVPVGDPYLPESLRH